MLKIAHIINPVTVDKNSDLQAAQPVTFESMRLAQDYAIDQIEVKLYSAQFPEDSESIPAWFIRTRHLKRSVLDIGSYQKQRKLPLIVDILERLYECSRADYFIYTNVDIALMPHFYTTVAQLIESGIDAMVINRRTIAKEPSDPMQIGLMWAQVGEKHPGYDCFIFRRDAYPQYDLGTACIGANWIGRVLLANVYAYAENFRIFEDLHLTFHLGDDRAWKISEHLDYDEQNQQELCRILSQLKGKGLFADKPLLEKFRQDIERTRQAAQEKREAPRSKRWWSIRGA